MIVGSAPDPDLNHSLEEVWAVLPAVFPKVRFDSPESVTIGGEPALRGLFWDSGDNSHGWFILARHNGNRVVIVAQAIPFDNWPNYESIFRAMLVTFRFTG